MVVTVDSAILTGTSIIGNTLQHSDDRGTVKIEASDNSIESENETIFFSGSNL